MAGVRVIVTINFPSAEVAEQAAAGMVEANKPVKERPGAVQYEVFRSAEDPCKVVLLEHWADRPLYDKHWRMQLAAGGPDLGDLVPQVEFYSHQNYGINEEGVWYPADEAAQSDMIRWA